MFKKIHHIAIICSDYNKSKLFYTEILGFSLKQEVYREERKSYKADLYIDDNYIIELFSFENSPKRLSFPEACGLRHLAFSVDDIDYVILKLKENNVFCEPVRIDPYTGKKFTFFNDPDNLPIEIYEG